MKGIVLHGGAGTRLRPLTYSGPKQLIPVANKPISQYAIEDLISSGIDEITIVLGETFPELVRDYYKDGSGVGAKITYVYQGRPLGIAHAISLCKGLVGRDRFVVYLGDNMLQHGIAKYVERFISEDYDAMVLLKEVEEPQRFGIAQIEEGKLVRVVEKPKQPPTNYALVGVYMFKPIVFDAIERIKPSWRGEYEVTDAIQTLIDWGKRVGYSFVEGWWADTGKKDDILTVNARVLDERIDYEVKGSVVNSKIEGRVTVEEGAKISGSHVRGPAVIGSGCLVEDSYIGPYTSLGKGSRVVRSSVEHSVVMEDATIEGVQGLDDSLIGRRARIASGTHNRRVLKLHIGDYSEVVL